MTLYKVESFLKKENFGRRRFIYEGIVDNVNYLHKRQKDAIRITVTMIFQHCSPISNCLVLALP